MLPVPVPLAAPLIVIQLAWLAAVHAQVAAVSMRTSRLAAPSRATFSSSGDTVNVQGGGGAAACVTVTVKPATLSVPTRSVVAVWLATV